MFALLFLTGGGDSLYYLLFFPLLAINAYYFGRAVGLVLSVVAGLLFAASSWLVPPWVGWVPVMILVAFFGLPAFAIAHVAARERRGRNEVERLNDELTGTLTRLQAAQQELLLADTTNARCARSPTCGAVCCGSGRRWSTASTRASTPRECCRAASRYADGRPGCIDS